MLPGAAGGRQGPLGGFEAQEFYFDDFTLEPADTIGHLGVGRQTAMGRMAAIGQITVEYRALPWLRAYAAVQSASPGL